MNGSGTLSGSRSAFVQLYGGLMLNIMSSVGVIFVNKSLVYDLADFRFGTLLTVIHFVVCFMGCCLFAKLGFFEPKSLNIARVLPISAAFCGYVVFNNLSLLTNTVSVYQTSKILCTPLILYIERVLYKRSESQWTLLSLIPICVGALVTVFSDANLTFVGTLWAALAVVSNSLYTIWGKTKQEELEVTPMQLLLYQAPISAFMLFFALPIDGVSQIFAYKVTTTTICSITLSCVFAFGVNFSFFLFVGQSTPLSMNVVGYLKTVLVFVGGLFLVSSAVNAKVVFGVILTLLGLASYTCSKMTWVKDKSIDKRNAV